jgi:LysM repeat protein
LRLMPKLGDITINNVKSEKYDEAIKSTDHPIEDGESIVDHIEKTPVTLEITGVIAGSDAQARLNKLRSYMNSGKLLKYVYKTSISNVIIESMPHDHIVDIAGGGFEFSIKLKQISLAKASILAKPKQTAPKSNKGIQQPKGATPLKIYVVVRGDNLTKIGRKYGLTWQAIYNKNKSVIGGNPNLIYPGQRYIIP